MYGLGLDPMTVVTMCDAHINAPQDVELAILAHQLKHTKIKTGTEKLPGVARCELKPGEWIQGFDAGGGGYG